MWSPSFCSLYKSSREAQSFFQALKEPNEMTQQPPERVWDELKYYISSLWTRLVVTQCNHTCTLLLVRMIDINTCKINVLINKSYLVAKKKSFKFQSIYGKDQYKGWWRDCGGRNVRSHPFQSFQLCGTMEQIRKLRHTESSCWDSVSVLTIKRMAHPQCTQGELPKNQIAEEAHRPGRPSKPDQRKYRTQIGHLKAKN